MTEECHSQSLQVCRPGPAGRPCRDVASRQFSACLVLARLPFLIKSNGQVCQPSLPAKCAGQVCQDQVCWPSLRGQVCRPSLPAKSDLYWLFISDSNFKSCLIKFLFMSDHVESCLIGRNSAKFDKGSMPPQQQQQSKL
jgi:hypothetical protein